MANIFLNFQVLFAFIFIHLEVVLSIIWILKKTSTQKKWLIDLFVGKQHNEVVVEGTCSFANNSMKL